MVTGMAVTARIELSGPAGKGIGGTMEKMEMSLLSVSGEKYIAIIYSLSFKMKTLRSVDIANYLNVTKPSVCRAIRLLEDQKMIYKEAKGEIHLTKAGFENAKYLQYRQDILKYFFEDTLKASNLLSCEEIRRISHIISDETIVAMQNYVNNSVPRHATS